MGVAQQMQDIVEALADLFPDAEDMSDLDAADFKDNSGNIWELVQRARDVRGEYS